MRRHESDHSLEKYQQVERPGLLYELILLEVGMLFKIVQYQKSVELYHYYLMSEDGQEIDNFVAEKSEMDWFLSPQVIFID